MRTNRLCEVPRFQLCTLTALFADSRDYELLVLALPAFTNCSGKGFPLLMGRGGRRRWRRSRRRGKRRRWDGVKIVHFGDEQPQRGASSALGDRYLATGSHVAKTRSCLVFFFSLSLSRFHFHSHSNTRPSLLYTSTHLFLSHSPPDPPSD